MHDAAANVLVVEDDQELRCGLLELLELEGFHAVGAADGSAALSLLRERPFDVVVLDLGLPGKDGWQFRAEQREDSTIASVPVIALSGDNSAKAIAIDAQMFIRKPFAPRVLLEALRRVLARSIEERANLSRIALADRMTSVGILAAGIGHEINNPLCYVIANLGLLAEALDRDVAGPEAKAMVRDAQEGAERIRKIVAGLKVFSRHDEEVRRPVALVPLLEGAVNMAFTEIRHRARLVKDFREQPMVEGDEGQLSQVFINLLVNAAQAIREGDAENNEIRLVTKPGRDGFVQVEIRDTGAGIPTSIQERIFEPFFTTKEIGAGTGLGLSISHKIITAHGGDITAQSVPGRWTTFCVTLPCTTLRPVVSTATGRWHTAPSRGRVLIVDDDQGVTTALQRMLNSEHDVHIASSGATALARIERGEKFDAVLCDLMMPTMTGMELFQSLQALAPELCARVIFMTGGAFTPSARSFLANVASPRIEKPFDAATVRDAIRRVVERS